MATKVAWTESGVDYALEPWSEYCERMEYFSLHIPTGKTTRSVVYVVSLYQGYQLLNYWNQQANWKYWTTQV